MVAELLPYLRPYLGRIVLALGLILGARLANMAAPIALKKIVDAHGLSLRFHLARRTGGVAGG